jgi:N-methylhydantoinase B
MTAADPVTLEVFQQRLIGIVREMRATMIHAAFSSAITELYDLSCALLDRNGDLVVQSEDNPQHVFPLIWTAREVVRRFGHDIGPDDVFLHNDPYEGGTHLNDIAVVIPFFDADGLAFFPVVRAHWEDVGGATHGSISGRAREIIQEGVRIPLTRLKRNSPEFRAVLDILIANMRIPHEREGDFRAMMGACEVAMRRLTEVTQALGAGRAGALAAELLDRAERRMRDRLARLPAGTYDYVGWLDPRPDLGLQQRIHVSVAIEPEGAGITVDFAGTSGQIAGPFNIGPSGAPTGVFMILKSLVDPKGPVNSGSFRPIRVEAPPGTFVNAVYPAAVGAMGDVRRSLESTIMAALAPFVPDKATGDTKGTSNQLLLGGVRPASNQAWLLYEAPSGGTGGFEGGDGNPALRTFVEGDFTAIQPIEAIEQKFPLRIEATALRPDSGGAGTWRGGDGIRRAIRFLGEQGTLSSVSDKNVIPPYGLFAGWSGAPNAVRVFRNGVEVEPSPAPGKIAGFPLEHGDLVVFDSSGGGGYGDPLDRAPAAVLADIELGLVSRDAAVAVYGIALDRAGGIDAEATTALRARLRAARPTGVVIAGTAVAGEGLTPCAVPPALAAKAGLAAGAIGELVAVDQPGAPVRVRIGIDAALGTEHLAIGGPPGNVGLVEGRRYWLRPLRPSTGARA